MSNNYNFKSLFSRTTITSIKNKIEIIKKKKVNELWNILNSSSSSTNTRFSASSKSSIYTIASYSSSIHIIDQVYDTKYYKKPEITTIYYYYY